ncbi:ATP-binding cassette domain-containing protein [Falsarthrobacter nasiphocae]|uniref:Macrolide transport system ATP-binding/permease protein n=1 Tax=Falsarthrobacter nasiphocae TaxID=189863 RepID=A0AAE3YF15_9MICC|nr:ATP-binding cassette domain-containing protein [Falsarthrobacter nasiphocae]MDR6892035.1 macrolide transport system ATP-binding/permease protein [Falsarthrobacter nasiphocae]
MSGSTALAAGGLARRARQEGRPGVGPILEARGLIKAFGPAGDEQTVVNAVDLTLYPGEMVALLGASGSGKSTLLNMLGLLLAPDEGELEIRGQRMDRLGPGRRSAARLAHVSHVFQAFHLIEHKTVFENVELPLIHARRSREERKRRVEDALAELGLEHRSAAFPATLSGGEKQRVAIARALVTRPDVLLCDEPTGSLDSARSVEVIDLLRDVTREDSVTVIVTHDESVAAKCDRVLRVLDGQIVEEQAALGGGGEREAKTRPGDEAAAYASADAGAPTEELGRRRGARWGWVAWTQAWNAFAGRLRRNLYTLLGVALGVSALVLSVGFAETAGAQISSAFDAYKADRVEVMRMAAGQPEKLTAAQAKAWRDHVAASRYRSIDGVRAGGTVHRLTEGRDVFLARGSGAPAEPVPVDGVGPEGLEALGVVAEQGRLFDEGHVRRGDHVAVVTEVLLNRLKRQWEPGMVLTVGDQQVSVIGVAKDFGDGRGRHADVYLPIGVPLADSGGESTGPASVVVVVRPGAADVVASQLPLALDPARPETLSAATPPEIKSLRQAVDQQQQILLVGMSALTLFIAGIGIMNTFIVAVMERRREIGIRMALGAPPRAIGAQFCWEAVLTALGGSVIGILFSVNALFLVAAFHGWTPVLGATTVLLGLGAGLLVGTCAGIVPAVRASRVQPVESLQQG